MKEDFDKAIDKQIELIEADIQKLKSHNLEKFFKACEEHFIEQFSWVQYSPHFNDGDACTFDVHQEMRSMVISGLPEEVADRLDDELSQAEGLYSYNYDEDGNIDYSSHFYAHPNLEKADSFDWFEVLGVTEELLNMLFGDGYEITVDVKNRTMTADDYDHD